MLDPLKSFETIVENYKRYVKTAFRTRFEAFEAERENLLNLDGTLNRQPWVEALPEYKSSKKTINDITKSDLGFDSAELEYFQKLVKCGLFDEKNELHYHQFEMLQKSIKDKKNCIITSGTGSGKTEAFLLPLFASLAKEAIKNQWRDERLNVTSKYHEWWRKNGESYSEVLDFKIGRLSKPALQRGHETRKPGVRALILYPMNALVEDQMTRLRIALDSDEARIFFDEVGTGSKDKWERNRIYFGRYNGATPIPGVIPIINGSNDPDKDAKLEKGQKLIGRLRDELRLIEKNTEKINEYILQNPNEEDKKYFFPRLDGAEMFSRFDMQETPPDIFITNFSMLSIMLMREADSSVFTKTKEWLDEINPESGKKENVFHLIIDELHLYRGTQGTEVAFLIRMLLKRLGLRADSEQLRILASSASLEPNDKKSFDFLKDFFGVEFREDQIIQGTLEEVDDSIKKDLDVKLFRNISQSYDLTNEDITSENFQQSLIEFSKNIDRNHLINDVIDNLVEWGIWQRFSKSFGSLSRAVEVWNPVNNDETLAGRLFGNSIGAVELKEAIRGLIILRGIKDIWDKQNDQVRKVKLPRLRFHFFIRNIEGIWANADLDSLNPSYKSGEDIPPMLKRTIGKLYSKSSIVDEIGNRLFDALYCENCGTCFLGGNRLFSSDSLEMIAVSPDIEGIPEKGSQSIIEKRKYSEYIVFWPKGEQPAADNDEISYSRKGKNGTWENYYLNKKSGSLDADVNDPKNDWVFGKLFVLDNDFIGTTINEGALPCTCPACGSNYEKGKTRTSPVRGFRSGFSKTAQILAKELFYQLPNEENKRKLVLFSDSREDAAQMANGIERSHFPDLVREAIISTLYTSGSLNISKIAITINELFRNRVPSVEDINTIRQNFPLNHDDIKRLLRLKRDAQDSLLSISDQQKAAEEFDDIVNTPASIAFENLVNDNYQSVLQILFGVGVNPQGCDRDKQKITGDNNNKFDWWDEEIFSLSKPSGKIMFLNNEAAVNDLKAGTLEEAAKVLFGKLYFGLESSGLAHIGLRSELYTLAISRRLNINKINSYIRVLGDNYYYQGSEYMGKAALGNWNKRVKNYMLANGDRPTDVYEVLRNLSFVKNSITYSLIDAEGNLVLKSLALYPTTNNYYFKCINCFRPHLHSSNNICTFCTGQIVRSEDNISMLWEKNFLAYHAKIAKRTPLRLHSEEMTGQTDDQFERQRHFRNMVLQKEGPARVKKIDLLCVTTTLEVGVDIGSLQAVMLGNMPPQRFNYQQRVGRAGRRGQAFSVILTFCRGRSHDEHYFNNPREITGDPPPIPVLSTEQTRIFKRVFNKFIISEAFRSSGLVRENNSRSTHGEMGFPVDWRNNRQLLNGWLNSFRNDLESHFQDLSFGTVLKWEEINKGNYYSGDGFIEEVDAKATDINIPGEEVADRLAEAGILPMFGMPTSVKNLYHGYDTDKRDMISIDRDQSMAITEFAPGAEKTKDKAILKSIGITPDLKYVSSPPINYPDKLKNDLQPFLYTGYLIKCSNCNRLETNHTSIDFDNGESFELPAETECYNCGMPAIKFPIIIPAAYRTDFKRGRDNKEGSDIFNSRPPIYAVPNRNFQPESRNGGNYLTTLSPIDTTWRVNNNANEYFHLERKSVIKNYQIKGVPKQHELTDQWVLPNADIQFGANQIIDKGNSIITSLAANKTTEVFRVHPQLFEGGFLYNMFDGSLQSSGVKSSVYSAAFLIQRAIAIDLDIDPTEIEIADIRNGENNKPVITLTDELPNGSGFVRHAFNNFNDLVNNRILNDGYPLNDFFSNIRGNDHKNKCKDACYRCLKVYRNMSYHGLLDWRLGFSWLRFLMNSQYKCGTDGNFEEFDELSNWPLIARYVAESMKDAFEGTEVENHEEKLFGFVCKGHPVIIIHPLWDFNCIKEEWLADAKLKLEQKLISKGAKRQLIAIDTFNGLRRPAKCKQW